MKAYKCDRCNSYFTGAPRGILYDNSDGKQGIRRDLCNDCLDAVTWEIEHGTEVNDECDPDDL